MTKNVDLIEVVWAAIASAQDSVRVNLPGEVVAYNRATQTADVKLSVRRRTENDDGETVYTDHPLLPGIQVRFPRTARFYMAFDLEPGDHVDVFFADYTLAEWRGAGSGAEPLDSETHGLSGAWCQPSAYPDAKALPNPPTGGAMSLGHITGDGVAEFDQDQVRLGRGAALIPVVSTGLQAAITEIESKLAAAGFPVSAPFTVATAAKVRVK